MLRRRQIRAIRRFIQKLVKTTGKISLSVLNNMIRTLVRSLFVTTRHRQRRTAAQTGFVLPTVALLLVVVALVIGAILLRTGSRTNQVIAEREQQVIYNAATPAIDRAKAKLEYLFKKDTTRLPLGVPPEETLMAMLLNESRPDLGITPLPNNPYLLPDEKNYLDINGGGNDAAWSYRIDTNGNGKTDDPEDATVAYSIIFKSRDPSNPNKNYDPRVSITDEKEKAKKLIVRNGPITSRQAINPSCKERLKNSPEFGWDEVSEATLRKTFQITAVVTSKQKSNRTVTTLEFQQDRELARGNKWGAWFRYDMHIHPRPEFRWNGAMHTEGSLFLGGTNADSVTNYLISSPDSCLYDPSTNSLISVGEIRDPANDSKRKFLGQVVVGTIFNDDFKRPGAGVHIYGKPNPDYEGANVPVTESTHSVNSGSPSQIALDPVALFTQDINQSSDSGDRTNENKSIDSWKALKPKIKNERFSAQSETPPYIDDTYRADDRLGPKPRYETKPKVELTVASGLKNGDSVSKVSDANARDQLIKNNPAPDDTDLKSIGLDGYWERRAAIEGLRIIVGPRLELGNPFGWTSDDPLYPPSIDRTHEERQRRTWRDNLAAVQATAVYHYKVDDAKDDKQAPVACLANTAHPGTQQSILDSRDFRDTDNKLRTNFFVGKGTNGWEYAPPPSGLGGSWDTAIKNLANFAGEEDGAFPPKQEGGKVHPNPYLAMWGNFSNLRRAIGSNGNNSIADQSYKYTAACTVGMLASNIEEIRQKAEVDLKPSATDFDNWSNALATSALESSSLNPPYTTVDQYIAAMSPPLSSPDKEKVRIYSLHEQIKRDRELGFVPTPITSSGTYAKYYYRIQYLSSPYSFGGRTYSSTNELALNCDISNTSTGNNYFGFGDPSGWSATDRETKEKKFIRLAASLCSAGTSSSISSRQPKFPSLYYLFPKSGHQRNHPETGDDSEPYVAQTSGSENFDPLEPSAILLPRRTDLGNFTTATEGSAGSRPNPNEITLPGGGKGYVSFLDSVMFDGRELMPIRVLDMDLELLRKKSISGDNWLPSSGVVYAFREDALREDAIARQENGSNPTNATKANPGDQRDPKVADNLISPKPVDYYPDPERRPYGFRLRNGGVLRRAADNPRGITFISDNPLAIQGNFNLHSNNENGTDNNLQEFTDKLGDSFGPTEFYDNRKGDELDNNFARLDVDYWRPAEILADAVIIVSKDFRDGSIEEGIRRVAGNSYGSMNAPDTNQHWQREDGSASEDIAAIPIKIDRNSKLSKCGSNSTSPCMASEYTAAYVGFGDLTKKIGNLNTPSDTQVNAILVSGVVPARKHQGNGGFHNFPRLLENWKDKPLRISGSFLQLNFSTYATGPYEQDAWEPTKTAADSGEQNTYYYNPPTRAWGYDVGLQYAPAGPLSKRLLQSQPPRSEFYEELKADDAYICQLRRAIAGKDGAETLEQVNKECPQ